MIKVLFVCMGNICRSPTAQGVFERLVREAGLAHAIAADSAGTTGYHVSDPPDARAVRAAKARDVDIGHLRARKVTPGDFAEFDLVLAMDRGNYRTLSHMGGPRALEKLTMFLAFAPGADPGAAPDVPDPYYGDGDGFERVLDLCEAAAQGLLSHLAATHHLAPRADGSG